MAQWIKDLTLSLGGCRFDLSPWAVGWRSGIATSCCIGCSCTSNLIPGWETSICRWYGYKKKKKKMLQSPCETIVGGEHLGVILFRFSQVNWGKKVEKCGRDLMVGKQFHWPGFCGHLLPTETAGRSNNPAWWGSQSLNSPLVLISSIVCCGWLHGKLSFQSSKHFCPEKDEQLESPLGQEDPLFWAKKGDIW